MKNSNLALLEKQVYELENQIAKHQSELISIETFVEKLDDLVSDGCNNGYMKPTTYGHFQGFSLTLKKKCAVLGAVIADAENFIAKNEVKIAEQKAKDAV